MRRKARNQIQRHRALLRDFCASAASQLTVDGQLWITLLSGQGGTPLDPIQRSPGDTWQLQHEAAKAGLLVRAVEPVDLETLEAVGYAPTGRRANQPLGTKRKQKGLVVHVLTAAAPSAGESAPSGVAPLEWTLDNSFWIDGDAVPSEATLHDHCREALGPDRAHALAEAPSLIDAYTRPADGRRARTYRFVYRSSVLPLSRERALEINGAVCEALAARCFEPRIPSRQALDELGQAYAQSGPEGEAA